MNLKEKCAFLERRIDRLNKISISLSKERNTNIVFELILDEARRITNADGQTLYMKSKDGKTMNFEIIRTDSKNISMGGTSGIPINYSPVKLFDDKGMNNMKNINTFVAHTGKTLNISDAYENKEYDFSGTIYIDKKTNYYSKSFLSVPLKNHEGDIIGVMQLINCIDKKTGIIQPFSKEMQKMVESLASAGAVALTNKQLILQLKNLFESFIKLIAIAIDKKSSYTSGHCERVPEIAMLLADAVHKIEFGKYQDFSMTEDERYELYIAAWLHDCGKISTPTHIVDKATKLETITDRIELVNTRFEILKRDYEISKLKQYIEIIEDKEKGTLVDELESKYIIDIEKLNEHKEFINKCNIGGEFMNAEDQKRIEEIGNHKWIFNGDEMPLLSKKDIQNLQISKGTLLPEERKIINEHIVTTIEMLEQLPYPEKLKRVPEFAGGHHEKINGKGYPLGLKGEDLSVQTKIMAIADIYEALTATDRPYKKGKKISEAMEIMRCMKNDFEIDKDIFDIFVKEKIYKKYAMKFLKKEQIDDVDEVSILN